MICAVDVLHLDKLMSSSRVLSRIFRLGEKSVRVAEGQEYSGGVQIFGNGYVLRCNLVH